MCDIRPPKKKSRVDFILINRVLDPYKTIKTMATKLRLQRHGKKGKPFYHLVAADSRAKRDGRFIEKLGTYNPNTNPATIDIDFDKTLDWVMKGAQPTDTVRAILSYKGVMYKKHLLVGVRKGALTEEEVEKRFESWKAEKDAKIQGKAEGLAKAEADAIAKQFEAEKAQNEARAKEIEAKNTPEVEEAPAEEETTEEVEATTEEAPAAEATEEAPAEEEKKDEE